MHLHKIVLGVLLWQPILALTLALHDAQIPVRIEHPHASNTVILAFTSGGGERVQRGGIPVHQQIPSGMDLPAHADTMRIETMLNDKLEFVSPEELSQVMCRVLPRFSEEERAALGVKGVDKAWPWFKIEDETVSFTQSSSRWFLAGRAIESYECR